MNLAEFRDWVQQIYATQDGELDCDGFFEVVHEIVDGELAGKPVSGRFPKAYHHMKQCPYCRDLYLTLRDVAQLEIDERAAAERPRTVPVPSDSISISR